MLDTNKLVRFALVATIATGVAAPSASAAQINQLCNTNHYTSIDLEVENMPVPAGSLIRILGYSGDYYKYRYNGATSYILRTWVTNSTCYWQ